MPFTAGSAWCVRTATSAEYLCNAFAQLKRDNRTSARKLL